MHVQYIITTSWTSVRTIMKLYSTCTLYHYNLVTIIITVDTQNFNVELKNTCAGSLLIKTSLLALTIGNVFYYSLIIGPKHLHSSPYCREKVLPCFFLSPSTPTSIGAPVVGSLGERVKWGNKSMTREVVLLRVTQQAEQSSQEHNLYVMNTLQHEWVPRTKTSSSRDINYNLWAATAT